MQPLPRSDNPWLADFLDGLRRRSRALKYKTRSIECERVFEEGDGDRAERIDLYIDRQKFRRPFILSATIWESRWAWVNICGGSKADRVEWSAEGRAPGVMTGQSLWTFIEETYDAARLMGFPQNCDRQQLDKMWDKVLLRGPKGI